MSYENNKAPVVKNHGVEVSLTTLRMCAEVFHHYEAQQAVERFLRLQSCFSPQRPIVLYSALLDNYTLYLEDKTWRPKAPEILSRKNE